MSLNSLQDDMSRRAASMAAMAKHANNPQEIQAIQQRLVTGVQNGTIQPYIGIPLIQDLTKKLTEAKAKMAQAVTGVGMPQPSQGGAPIAQQVLAQAAQEDRGVEALPSNLPQQYAGGGIIAFEDGGQVEHYQNRGYTGDPSGMGGSEIMSAAGTADPYVGKGLLGALTFAPDDPEWKRKLKVEQALRERDAAMGVTPLATPAATVPITPYGQSQAVNPLGNAPAPAAPGGPGSTPGGINFKMPVLGGMKETAAPTLTDYSAITKQLPEKLQEASEKAVKATQSQLEEFDKPLEAKGERIQSREAQLAKDSEISRWLSVIKGGLATMGGTSKIAAKNIAEGLGVGIDDAIRGEAANRAAKEKLETAKDNLDDQRIAAKKGNYQAAQQAGNRAADDLRQSTQLTMTGAHYGNTEALNRYQTQQQGEFQRASLDQSGKLGIAGLGLQAQQLAQTGAFQNKQLGMMEQRYAAMDKQAQARMQQVRAGAVAKFNETMAPQINAQLMNLYGKNWRVGTDPKSLEAQMKFKQAQNAYIMDALGQHDASMAAKDSSEY